MKIGELINFPGRAQIPSDLESGRQIGRTDLHSAR